MNIVKYMDESTTEEYRFTFYCECCGKFVKKYASTSPACYKPKLFSSPSERKARELLWMRGHDEAFENASHEALQVLNRCEVCGALVCDECTIISDKLNGGVCCKNCNDKVEK